MDEKNTIKLSFDTDAENLRKELNRSLGFFKSFVTTFNKTLSKIGNVSSIGTKNSISPSQTIKNETDSLLSDNSLLPASDNAVKKIKKNNKEIGDSFTELRIVGIYAFRRLSRAFSNAIKEMSNAGAELYELNSRFSLIMGEMTNDAEHFAKKLGEAYGLNESTIKENILKLYTLGQNAGLANDQALELTKTMSRLGVEVASVWDVPIEQATDNLISALQGLPRAMKKYGSYVGAVDIKEFFNQYRQSKGLQPLTRELTRQEKVLGVYLKSLSDLGYAFGDFERTVLSVKNQLRIAEETFITLKQTGGILLNEFLTPFLKFGNSILKVITNLTKSLRNLHPAIKFVVGMLMTFVLTIPTIVGTATLFIYYIAKMKQSLASLSQYLGASSKKMLTFGKITLQVAKWSGLLLGLIASIQMVVDAFSETKDSSDSVTDSLKLQQNTAKDLKRTLSSFDDVNIFKTADSSTDSLFGDININEFLESINLASEDLTNLNSLFEESTKWSKIFSIALLSIDIIGIVSNIGVLKNGLKNLLSVLKNNYDAVGAFTASILNVIALSKNVHELFKNWSDMSTAQKIVSFLTAIASAVFLLASAMAALKGRYTTAFALAAFGTIAGVAGANIAMSAGNKKTSINNNPTQSNIISSAYNPNENVTTGIGTSISNAVMSGLSSVNSDTKPINVNINVNVDEEYIYKSYNKVAKQNGVM